jgi:hypothetical protein
VTLEPDINTNQVMMAVQTKNQNLVLTRWTGITWRGIAELEDATGSSVRQPFMFLWDLHERNPNSPTTTAIASAGSATQVNDNQEITVALTVTASRIMEDISVPDPQVFILQGDNGGAVKLSGPSVSSVPVGQGGTTFEWTYRIEGGAEPVEMLFRWDQFSSGISTFPAVESNSVPVVPELAFEVDIQNPSTVPAIINVASINLSGWEVPSNTVITPLSESLLCKVFADYNLNGEPGADEPGLAGVRVFLEANGNGEFDQGETEMPSDDSGSFVFPGVGPGTWHIAVDVNSVPPDFIPFTPTLITRVLAPGQSALDCFFAMAPRPSLMSGARVAGVVWLDKDEDGVFNNEIERALPGVTVRLFRHRNNNGILDAGDFLVNVTTTNETGAYGFSALPSGRYLVAADDSTAPPGAVFVGGPAPGSNPRPLQLMPNQIVNHFNFGYNYTGVISGLFFYDKNADGIRQPDGEDGIPGNEDDEAGVPGAVVALVIDAYAGLAPRVGPVPQPAPPSCRLAPASWWMCAVRSLSSSPERRAPTRTGFASRPVPNWSAAASSPPGHRCASG